MKSWRSAHSIKFLALALTLAYISACSSTPEKAQVSSPEPQITERDEEPKPTPQVSATPVPERPAAPAVRARKLDSRYDSLVKALRQSGKATEIEEEASRLLGSDQNDTVALNTLALLHLRRGRPKAAKLLLLRALEKGTPTAALHNNLGVAYLDDGDQEAAILEFKKALQLDESHAEALGNLGSIYLKGGDAERAFPMLEKAYKANRGNAAIANNYALALRTRNDFEGARRVYDDLLKAHPNDVNALLNYAILLIDFMNKPKDGLDLVFKVKFHETQRKDVLATANALEKKAKSALQ